MRPRFSVVIAVRNGAATLARAIDSVLGQTEPAFELIVVDDGSTDETPAVARRYGERLRYLGRPPGGVAVARNAGAAAARGDWLAFLDADDWYLPDRIRRHAAWIRDDATLDFLTGEFEYRDGEGRLLRRSMPTTALGRRLLARGTERVAFADDDLHRAFVAEHFGDTHTLSVPRSTFLDLGGYPPGIRVCEDVHFLVRLAARSRKAGAVTEPLAVYTIHERSATRSDPLGAQEETLRALRLVRQDPALASRAVRAGLDERLRRARLDLAYARLRAGRRLAALRAVAPLILAAPGPRSLRDLLSIARGALGDAA